MGAVTARAMFGGAGLYLDGVIFAIIVDGALYFKVDDENRPEYEAAGSGPFVPFPDKPYAMSYYRVPPKVMADGGALNEWARRAWEASRRGNKRKKAKR